MDPRPGDDPARAAERVLCSSRCQLQLAAVLVGAIVIEQVFVLPGLGSKLLYAVSQSDTMVIQGIVMLLVLAVLGINFIVDVSYVLLDPRLRSGNSR